MEMEMVAAAEVDSIGEDLTPPLSPLSYSLHDSFLHSHCSSCFSSLPPNPLHHSHLFYYCSPSCSSSSSSHSPLHLPHLLRLSQNPLFIGEASDLRVALLLLLQIKSHQPFIKDYHRICGFITNRHKLLIHHDLSTRNRIKNGARAIALALDSDSEYLLEEAVLCLVLTNAVEVQDRVGVSVGIAVYDISFSWINHSCSPNAFYRFLAAETDTHGGGGQRCLITPASSDAPTGKGVGLGWREIGGGGPRIVVTSIKKIKKGEKVTIAYTDLLHPKELRQLELWSRYMFTCCCSRCAAQPLTYVDHCLQEISTSNGKHVRIESFTEYINDAIDDYLSSNDPKSCCNKLENALLNGFHHDTDEIIRLHPQHHLSLNAYTTLASAYKVLATAMEDEDPHRFSAAYSLLLPLLTHPLFLSESSLIASVSNFWIGAGESLLNLATLVSDSSRKCSRCRLIDMFEADFDDKVLDIANEFLNCCIITSDITHKVWKFLVRGNAFLEVAKEPIDFVKSVADNESVEGQERVVEVGVHCLLYGGILSNIINGGRNSELSSYVGRLLYLSV